MSLYRRIQIRIKTKLNRTKQEVKPTPKLITTWEELAVEKSETHVLDIDLEYGCGWIVDRKGKGIHYLSTHTFYGSTHTYSTNVLRSCGFNVVVDNWDADLSTAVHNPVEKVVEK